MAGCLPPQTRQRQRSPNPTHDFLSSGLPGATLGLAQDPSPELTLQPARWRTTGRLCTVGK